MNLYDHKTLTREDSNPAEDADLDAVGKEGWELVSVAQNRVRNVWHYFFRRPYQDDDGDDVGVFAVRVPSLDHD